MYYVSQGATMMARSANPCGFLYLHNLQVYPWVQVRVPHRCGFRWRLSDWLPMTFTKLMRCSSAGHVKGWRCVGYYGSPSNIEPEGPDRGKIFVGHCHLQPTKYIVFYLWLAIFKANVFLPPSNGMSAVPCFPSSLWNNAQLDYHQCHAFPSLYSCSWTWIRPDRMATSLHYNHSYLLLAK